MNIKVFYMTREYTYKHTRTPCPECRTNKYTVLDSHHAETYCKKCGLVISDSSIFSIKEYLETEETKEHIIYSLHRRKR